MATRPNLVPEDQPWLILTLGDKPQVEVGKPSKRECFEWILEARLRGDTNPYFVYGPDSKHEHAIVNQVAWERTNG